MTDRVKSNDNNFVDTHEVFFSTVLLQTFHTKELDLGFLPDVSVTLITERSDWKGEYEMTARVTSNDNKLVGTHKIFG